METQRKGRNFLEWVDPRIKLYIMLLFGTMMFMAPNNFVLIWDYSVVFIFWMLSSKKKTAVTWTIIFFVFLYLNELLGYIMLENKKFYQENNRPYYQWYVERYKKFLDQKIF